MWVIMFDIDTIMFNITNCSDQIKHKNIHSLIKIFTVHIVEIQNSIEKL